MNQEFPRIFVPGGAGYVGSVLVPRLLTEGYRVSVLDRMIYGPTLPVHQGLDLLEGDIRDEDAVRQAARGCQAVIHLACISNDPSVELDPDLSKSVNFDCFGPLIRICQEEGARRFVFASSGSVYGVSDSPDVREDHPLVPVSLYNKYKALCEPVLLQAASPNFVPVIIRPATICGVSPRQRLDLTVNLLTAHALANGKITVFGGSQMRPNLHMADMIDLYLQMLQEPDSSIAGEIFNAGYQNYSVRETAEIVRRVLLQEAPELGEIPIVTTPSDDIRSYQLSAQKIGERLGFVARHTVEEGARDVMRSFRAGHLPNAMTDDRYYNVRRMKSAGVT